MKSTVEHSRETGGGRGILLATYIGEIADGDEIRFEPDGEDLSRFSLTVTVGELTEPLGDQADISLSIETHQVVLRLRQIQAVQPAVPGIGGWPPPRISNFQYSCALSPTSFLRFTVILSLDFTPRVQGNYFGLRLGEAPVCSPPEVLGPIGRIEWWVNLVEAQGLPVSA